MPAFFRPELSETRILLTIKELLQNACSASTTLFGHDHPSQPPTMELPGRTTAQRLERQAEAPLADFLVYFRRLGRWKVPEPIVVGSAGVLGLLITS
jgi:hypothetical protein